MSFWHYLSCKLICSFELWVKVLVKVEETIRNLSYCMKSLCKKKKIIKNTSAISGILTFFIYIISTFFSFPFHGWVVNIFTFFFTNAQVLDTSVTKNWARIFLENLEYTNLLTYWYIHCCLGYLNRYIKPSILLLMLSLEI